MKFALNYSHPAARLVQEKRIEINFFKTPDWPGMIAEASRLLPVAVHFSLKAGSGRLEKKAGWASVAALRDQTGVPYVNLHLAPRRKDYPGYAGEDDLALQRQVFANLLADVRAATTRFGAEQVIAENVPYYLDGKTVRFAVEPGAIRRLLDETGCGLLLDISHARIAADSLGMDAHEYMEQLPVDRLRELHFTGLHRVDGVLLDHLPVLERDWPELEWVLERIRAGAWARPWMLALEYGGVGPEFDQNSDPEVMAAQVPRIYRSIRPI